MIGIIACSELHKFFVNNFSFEDKHCCGSNLNGCLSELIKANIGRTTARSGDTENHRLKRYSETGSTAVRTIFLV